MSWRDHHYRSNLLRRNANQWNRSWGFLGQNFFYRVAIPRCIPRYSRVDYRKDISSRIPDANFDAFLRETQNRRDTKRYSSADRSQATPMFELLWAFYAEIYAVDTARLERNRSHICEITNAIFIIIRGDALQFYLWIPRSVWTQKVKALSAKHCDLRISDLWIHRYISWCFRYLHVCKYV